MNVETLDLNLDKNHLTIDTSLSKAHYLTSPIWNEAWSPLYKKSIDSYEQEAFDIKGNHYYIDDGAFYINGEKIRDITQKCFKRTEETLHTAIDVSGATLDFENGKAIVTYNDNTFTSPQFFTTGVLLDAKIKKFDNRIILVIVYNTDINERHYQYYTFDESLNILNQRNSTFNFYRCRATTTSYSQTVSSSITSDDILIWLGPHGATIFNTQGWKVNLYSAGYFVILENNDIIHHTGELVYQTGTETVTTTQTTTKSYNINYGSIQTGMYVNLVLKDGDYYRYKNATVLGDLVDLPVGVIPVDTGTTTPVAEEDLELYRLEEYSNIYSWSDENNTILKYITEDSWIDTAPVPSKYWDVPLEITDEGETFEIPSSYWTWHNHPGQTFTKTFETTGTTTVTNFAAPVLYGEDGYLYGFTSIESRTTITPGSGVTPIWSLKAAITGITTTSQNHTIAFESEDYIQFNNTTYRQAASMGAELGQNGYIRYTALFRGGSGTTERWWTVMYDSGSDVTDYFGGTQISSDLMYNDTDNLPFVSYGAISPIADKWRLLYNSGIVTGISYGDKGYQGTLLSEWGNIDDEYYISADDTNILYKENEKLYKISIVDGVQLSILFDRYVIINTTDYYNCWDIKNNHFIHYALDWNNRAINGRTDVANTFDSIKATLRSAYMQRDNRTEAVLFTTGINSIYTLANEGVVSLSIGPQAYWMSLQLSTNNWVTLLYGKAPYNAEYYSYPIDIYAGKVTATYQFSLIDTVTKYKKSELLDLPFPIQTNAASYFTPNIFTEYIKSYNNKDMVRSGKFDYLLQYIYGTEPSFSWSTTSQQEDVTAIFVIQGQFYGVINNKICALVYQGQTLLSVEAIIDVTGLQYLGYIPTIAYFYSNSTHSLYAFTGDANLTLLKECTDWNTVDKSFFNPGTQTLYITTDKLTYVFAPANTYIMEAKPDNVYFLEDGGTIFKSDDDFIFYYEPKEEYEPMPVKIETMLYGPKDNKWSGITRWNLTLLASKYDDLTKPVSLACTVLTDYYTKSSAQDIIVDKWKDVSEDYKMAFIQYTPTTTKGQGQGLYISSPFAIHSINFDTGTGSGSTIQNFGATKRSV